MMDSKTNREILCDMGYEDAIVFDNPSYDSAIVGVSIDGNVIYDYDEMIRCLMVEDGMSSEDAADFIDYNTIRSLPYAGDSAPIVIYKI